jgi:protein transport protein SEC23
MRQLSFPPKVRLYELAFEACPKSYVFSGKKDIDPKTLPRMLGMAGPAVPGSGQAGAPSHRFILPLADAQLTLETIVEGILPDTRQTKPQMRAVRSSGAAIALAVSLAETLRLQCATRIMCFLGGPCTHGPGQVVGVPLKEPMRAHFDLEKDSAPFAKAAFKFYETLGTRACQNGHVIDIFAGSLDQVGVMELRQLVQKTSGYLVNAESFEHRMFKDTFRKVFARDGNGNLNMGFNATVEVQTSRELKVMGGIGHMVSMGKKAPCVSDRAIGESGTCAWRVCAIDPLASFAFYFSVVHQEQPPKRGQKGLIQFTSSYIDGTGAHILRVTTIARPFVTSGVPGQQQDSMVDPMSIRSAFSVGFDQEAAAVLMARLAVFKTREEAAHDIIRWLDRSLISFAQQFGDFMKGDQSSFRFGRSFGLLPQFFFHLRRSCFLQNFNNSPDESTYFRYMLLRENCPNCMTMIQPRLEAYTFQQKGYPVLLSSTSLGPDRILMLDTFFHVVIWHGKSIADWKARGYQNDPNYATFKELLEAPQQDAKVILEERIPTPMFKSCDHDHGDARYLLAVIDPAQTYSSATGQAGETIATDDVNLQVFVEHLAKLTVTTTE